MENKKINTNNVKLWKYYFQTVKLRNHDVIFPQIEENLSKRKQNDDKYAIEVLCGLAKANRVFNFSEANASKSLFVNVLNKYCINFSSESSDYWENMFKCCFYNRDLRRVVWAVEFLFDDNLACNSQLSPYYQTSFLNFLLHALKNNWKYQQISLNVQSYLLANLNHPFQNVRIAIGE